MTTHLRASHIVCKVNDIRALVRDFTELGFTMEFGSAPERAHNALLWFAEGPFIEFFELSPKAAFLRLPFSAAFGAGAGERLAKWARTGEGWRDLALETDDLDLTGTRSALRSSGAAVSRVIKGRRTRPDGQRVRYQFLAPRPSGLPFVVSAYDPPQRPASIRHANGAQGVSRIRLGVAEADRFALARIIDADTDPWLSIEPAAHTGVLGVEIAGLNTDLDPAKAHGAILSPHSDRREGTRA